MKRGTLNKGIGYEVIEFLDEETPKEEVSVEAVKVPHVLVVDDDPLFRSKVRRIAEIRNLPVTVCSTLQEVSAMAESKLFDIAVVDYYLDDLKQYLRGTDVASVLEETPVILISSTSHGIDDNTPFPDSVRQFLNKQVGINAILDTAIHLAKPSPEL